MRVEVIASEKNGQQRFNMFMTVKGVSNAIETRSGDVLAANSPFVQNKMFPVCCVNTCSVIGFGTLLLKHCTEMLRI